METIRVAAVGECMLELQGPAFGQLRQHYGGDTFNAACYLARCGPAKVSYASALGDDSLSEALLQRWGGEGLELSLVRRLPGRRPGLYQIELDAQGERRFHFWRGQSAARDYFDCTEPTPLEQAEGGLDALLFSGISLAILPDAGRERLLQLAARLRAAGRWVAFDNNYRPILWRDAATARHWFERAFAVASLALITTDDHQALFDLPSAAAAVAAAQDLAVPELVLKRGAAPTLVRGAGAWTEVPTQPVARVVDTTAAGDSFAGGYLSRRLRGEAPAQAADFGNRLAARVIQHPGAVIPREAMQDLL
ncbi:sugar kinase [Inhella sp.]|uniref:sugar kinase n=1 Tax=Inhella sp. TaxID=1921806 RepID=UPI0035B00AAE